MVIVVIVQYGAARPSNVVSYTKSCYTKTCFFLGGGEFILFSSVQFGRFGRIAKRNFFIIKSAISRPYSEILSNHVCDF